MEDTILDGQVKIRLEEIGLLRQSCCVPLWILEEARIDLSLLEKDKRKSVNEVNFYASKNTASLLKHKQTPVGQH